jgi:hypothetical protein
MKCKCENCEKCPYPDCICDDFDYSISEELDRQILKEREIVEDSEPIRTGKRGRPKLTPSQREERDRKQKEKRKKYYKEHRKERLEYAKKYQELHKEQCKENRAEWYKRIKALYGNEYFNRRSREYYHRQRQNKSAV